MKLTRFFATLAILPFLASDAIAQVTNGKVTAAAPTYTTNTIAPLSLDTAGSLRTTTSGSAGSSTKVNCVYNTTLPTYTNGQTTECQTDVRGNLSVAPALNVVTGADGVLNTVITSPNSNTSLTSGLRPPASAPWYFNGTTWDRVRGDTNGAYAQGNVASGATDAGNPVKIGGKYNATLPTLTDGQRGDIQLDTRGNLSVLLKGGAASGVDGVGNSGLVSVTGATNSAPTGSPAPLYSAPYYFNGTSWDRTRGDTNGAYMQGNVASGAADAGNPVKIGGYSFSSAPAAVTNGQRSNAWFGLNGNLAIGGIAGVSVDGEGTTLTNIPDLTSGVGRSIPVATKSFNGTSWDRNFTCPNTAIINVTAGTTGELVPLSGSTITRVCSYSVTASANGTFTFSYGTGAACGTGNVALTGAMAIAANDNNSLSSGNGSLMRTAAGNALCLAAVTGNMTGFVTYARY